MTGEKDFSKHPRLRYVGEAPTHAFDCVEAYRDGKHVANVLLHDGGAGGTAIVYGDGGCEFRGYNDSVGAMLLAYDGPPFPDTEILPDLQPVPWCESSWGDGMLVDSYAGSRVSETLGPWSSAYAFENAHA